MKVVKLLTLAIVLGILEAPIAYAAPPSTFLQGGNSFGTAAVVGTNDNFPLILETNDTERLRLDADRIVIDSSRADFFMNGQGRLIFSQGDFTNPSSLSGMAEISYTPAEELGVEGLSIDTEGGNGYGIFIQRFTGNIGIDSPYADGDVHIFGIGASATLYLGGNPQNVELQVGNDKPGCLALGDSDGVGVTYVTANDGVLSATTTKPGTCD